MGLISANARSDDVLLSDGNYDAVYKELLVHEPEDEEDDPWMSLIFDVAHEGEEVEKALHTSNILSMYGDGQSSKLGQFFENLGLEEVIDDALDAQGELASGDRKFVIGETEDDETSREEQIEQDAEKLRTAFKAALAEKKLKLLLVTETNEEGEERNSIERAVDWEHTNPDQKSEEQKEERTE